MAKEKYTFAFAALLMLAFVGFMFANSGSKSQPAADAAGGTASGAGNQAGNAIPETKPESPQPVGGQLQEISVRAMSWGGYDKDSITVKSGQMVKFDFSAEPGAGCGRQLIIDGMGVNLVSRNGETVSATFTLPTPGQYRFHCGMNMFRGVLTAT